jgi:hypothetical protein
VLATWYICSKIADACQGTSGRKKARKGVISRGYTPLLARQTSSMKHKGLFSLFKETIEPGNTEKHSHIFSLRWFLAL